MYPAQLLPTFCRSPCNPQRQIIHGWCIGSIWFGYQFADTYFHWRFFDIFPLRGTNRVPWDEWVGWPTCQSWNHTSDEMGLGQQGMPKVAWEPFLRSMSWCWVYATTSYSVYAITVGRQNVFAKTKLENCVGTTIPHLSNNFEYSFRPVDTRG